MTINEHTFDSKISKAADRFFSIYPGSHGFILLLYLRKTKRINIIENAKSNQTNILASLDINTISNVSNSLYTEWTEKGVSSQSVIAEVNDNPQLQKAFDYIIADMLQKCKNYNAFIFFEIIIALEAINDEWFNQNYSKIVDKFIQRDQGYSFKDLYFQPVELTSIIGELAEYNGGRVFNPFAGVASYAKGLKLKTKYYGQEINPLIWSLGVIELLSAGIDTSDFRCEDSIQSWPLISPSIIIATPPFGLNAHSNNDDILDNTELAEDFFIRKGLDALHSGGKLIGVFPSSIIRRQKFDISFLDTVILMPTNLFYNTSESTVILIFKKDTEGRSLVRMIDGTSYFKKNGRINILNWKELIHDINNENSDIVRNVSLSEIKKHENNLSPILYINENIIKDNVPFEHKVVKLKELLNLYSCPRTHLDSCRIVTGKELASDRFSIEKTFDYLPEKYINDYVYSLDRNLLLTLKSGQNLKPTYFKKIENFIVGYDKNILAYTIQEKKVLPAYLINELSKEYVKRQIVALFGGVTIPYFSPDKLLQVEIYLPDLPRQKELLDKEKDEYFTLKLQEANIEIDNIKNVKHLEYVQIISQRKHAISQVLNEFETSFSLISDKLIQNGTLSGSDIISARSHETVSTYLAKIKMTVKRLLVLVDVLNDSQQFGAPEDIWLGTFISEYCNNRLLQDFKLDYKQDEADYDLVFPEINMNDEIFGGVMVRKGDKLDLYQVSISRRDLTQIFDNIISNAIKHGFNNKSRHDYCVRIMLDKKEIGGKNGVAICISNNGAPLPKGMDKENIFIWGASSSNSTGIGMHQVRNIAEHFGGTANLNIYPDEPTGFTLEYEIVLPTTNSF